MGKTAATLTALGLVAALSACTESSTVTTTVAGIDSSTPTTSVTSPVTASPPVSGQDAAQVSIKDFAFNPAQLSVASSSQEIAWTNDDSIAHTVTLDDGSLSDRLEPGETFTTVLPVGTHAYHCSIHPSMKGTITVSG